MGRFGWPGLTPQVTQKLHPQGGAAELCQGCSGTLGPPWTHILLGVFFPSLIEMDIDILVLIVTIKLFILVPLHLFLRFFEYISVQCQSTCDRNVLRLQRGRQSSGQAGGFWVQNWT